MQGILIHELLGTTRLIVRQRLEAGLAGKVALPGNGKFTNPDTVKVAPSVLNGAVEAAA